MSVLIVSKLVCFLLREGGHDHGDKLKRPYLMNKAYFGKICEVKYIRKHHEEVYNTLFSAWKWKLVW